MQNDTIKTTAVEMMKKNEPIDDILNTRMRKLKMLWGIMKLIFARNKDESLRLWIICD